MTIKYTKEQLNKFDKELLIELFLGMQGQMGLSYSLMKQRQSATWMHRNLMTWN